MGRTRELRLIFLVVTLLLGACGELTPPDERGTSYSASSATSSYTVRPGDTLYSIAWGTGVDVRELASWNSIAPPYTIYPGQRISLTPPVRQRSQTPPDKSPTASSSNKSRTDKSTKKSVPKAASTRGSLVKPRHTYSKAPSQSEKASSPSTQEVEKSGSSPNTSISGWTWPTKGRLVNRFELSSGRKGIDIGGRAGQEIFTAAAGDVVYSGNGLLGYGNLVIIKHDDIYLSAYGHNSQLLVKEGDKVTAGQKIAEMGVSPKEGAILHFEIRREGKPVDPLVYLPK